MGVNEEAFRKNFSCVNLSPYYDPDGFSPGYHVASAKNMAPLLAGKRVVLLGPAVAEAFEIPRMKFEWCQWIDHPSWDMHAIFTVIPHPSGANRLYNDPQIYSMVSGLLNMLWEIRDEHKPVSV